MKSLLAIISALVLSGGSAFAGWEVRRIPASEAHSKPRVVLVLLHQSSDRGFPTVDQALASLQPDSEIKLVDLISLHSVVDDDSFQQELLANLTQLAPEVMKAAKRSGGNMHNPKMIALRPHFEKAVMQTKLVATLNTALSAHGLSVKGVSHEKLSWIEHEGERRLMCLLWLTVGETETAAAATRQP